MGSFRIVVLCLVGNCWVIVGIDTQDINGRLLTVNKAAPRGSRPERPARAFNTSLRIYVGNLPWQIDNSGLEQVFSEHGKVIDARVVYDRETGRSRGFGFVTMSTQTEVDDAIGALDGQVEERMTLCNMVIDVGRKNGVDPVDNITYHYLEIFSTSANFFSVTHC